MKIALPSEGLPESGAVLSSVGILDFMSRGGIQIPLYDEKALGFSGYRLQPGALWEPTEAGPKLMADLRRVPSFAFRPHEYLIVTPLQDVVLGNGLIGTVSEFELAQRCFGLVAGKVDPGYGRIGGRRQSLIFGIVNQLAVPNRLNAHEFFAELTFTFLGSSGASQAEQWSPEDRLALRARERYQRAYDDAPSYE